MFFEHLIYINMVLDAGRKNKQMWICLHIREGNDKFLNE